MNKKFDVVSQILRNAEIAPKKIAVEDMSGCLTYEQLVQQSMNFKQKDTLSVCYSMMMTCHS